MFSLVSGDAFDGMDSGMLVRGPVDFRKAC